MGTIVLIIVVAAWGAVLVPPLMRGRSDNSPHSSVLDFRRQLSTLQRSAPYRQAAPMRSMARPLAPSPSRSGRPEVGYERPLDSSASLRRMPVDLASTTRSPGRSPTSTVARW